VQPHSAPPSSLAPSSICRPDHRRSLGVLGEDLAAAHFARLGFSVLARNVRTRYGEIDLIAFDGHTLAFVEVKTRRASPGTRGLDPLAGLGGRQRARLRRLATAWLSAGGARPPAARTIRFDAVGVSVDAHGRLLRLDHLEGAW
jgi:putative endonuclease